MSEKYAPREHSESLKPTEHSHEQESKHHEKELTNSEKTHGNEKQLDELGKAVEQMAISGKEKAPSDTEHSNQHPIYVNRQLKTVAFDRAMTRARKKLSIPSKLFSKVIHTQPIDRSSEFIGKTVARPTSMLSGAFIAFSGTSVLLWLTRKYGYEYNYLVVILLFIAGWAIGLIGEFFWKSIIKNRR